MRKVVNDYIASRYNNWMDYAKYHCEQAGITDQYTDILNEVYLMLADKGDEFVFKLYNSKKNQLRELDYYVLRMIKLNIQSPTSPYQAKYNKQKKDQNITIESVHIADEEDIDDETIFLQQIEHIYSKINFNKFENSVYNHIINEKRAVKDWEGEESHHIVYAAFRMIKNVIRIIADSENNNCDIEKRITGCSGREKELITNYFERKRASNTIRMLYLSEEAINLFSFIYIQCNKLSEWPSNLKKKDVQKKYDKIFNLYKDKLNNLLLF